MARAGGQGMDRTSACEFWRLRTDPPDDAGVETMMIVEKGGKGREEMWVECLTQEGSESLPLDERAFSS